ncbi:MAG: hypothetical protein EBU46_05815 [Nitrosomonadaceae bacterium]|nr:hypothetical protein [Nitrosomonadaceae bacterium]
MTGSFSLFLHSSNSVCIIGHASCISVTDAPDLDRFTRIPVSLRLRQELIIRFKLTRISLFSSRKSAYMR